MVIKKLKPFDRVREAIADLFIRIGFGLQLKKLRRFGFDILESIARAYDDKAEPYNDYKFANGTITMCVNSELE